MDSYPGEKPGFSAHAWISCSIKYELISNMADWAFPNTNTNVSKDKKHKKKIKKKKNPRKQKQQVFLCARRRQADAGP